MSRSSTLGSVLYNLETTWGEDVDTFGSRMAVVDRIDVSSLIQEQIERNIVGDRKQFGVRRALVRGQILPGVPVWRLGAEALFPGLDYIVFPGNVGGDTALADAVGKFVSPSPP